MQNKLNDYTKSREYFERALKVIPSGVYGHLGPASGCMTPVEAYPFFASKAQGQYFWDADGNKFLDYMCAYGPSVLGYGDPDVDEAFKKQLADGDCLTLPSFKMVELAELLVDTVKSANWAYFMKNGGDATSYSIMIAREATRRKKIVFVNGFYHGVMPWCQKIDNAGVIEDDIRNALYIEFNDFTALEKVFAEHGDSIAGFIGTPYMHGNFKTNVTPANGYWQRVRELCTKHSSVLIIDDIRCGFRLDLAGSDHFYGFEADLICFCKAIANGYNISALCGKDFLKPVASAIMFTGSYWMSSAPMAAAIANINKLKKLNAPKFLKETGQKVTDIIVKAGALHGFEVEVSGEPALFYLMLKNDYSQIIHQQWVAECVKRGVFLTNHHNHFTCMAMTDSDINFTGEVAEEAFKVTRKNNPKFFGD
ncbi:MAG: aminotransferase class III-fold pyridoxal phosphate-dependent enzyme [Firmicutes bacterium]|nr:aminotransferase class III-fold pyridoxal phosphate-dependent enzyme [Bacillota bacterium]